MIFIANLIKSIVLGFIEGITEWLPISSAAHLLLFNSICSIYPSEFFEIFKVFIQFGSIIAVLVLYQSKLNPFISSNRMKQRQSVQLWLKIIIGCIPACFFGFLLDDFVESNFVIAVALIFYGVIFILIEKKPRKTRIDTIHKIDYFTSLKIGFFQCLALIPGTSRSIASILGGLSCGCSRYVASEFSFFIAIPVMIEKSVLKMVEYFRNVGFFSFSQLILLIFGTLISFFVSVLVIQMFLNYIRKHDFKIFGIYRILLGLFVILYFYIF